MHTEKKSLDIEKKKWFQEQLKTDVRKKNNIKVYTIHFP